MKIGILIFTVLTWDCAAAQQGKILMVLSAADTLRLNQGEKLRQTGIFLNEFYLAYCSVSHAGYEVEIATPCGKLANIDPESTDNKYWNNEPELKNEAMAFTKDSLFLHPRSLQYAINHHTEYVGLIIPGGQGLMVDLAFDVHIPILIKQFAEDEKPTGLICHAPSLLLSIPEHENPYIGFKVNSASPLEEFIIERFIMKGKPDSRRIAERLRKLGLKYRSGLPKANFGVRDRNLVSSQNPFSSAAFNELFLQALKKYHYKN